MPPSHSSVATTSSEVDREAVTLSASSLLFTGTPPNKDEQEGPKRKAARQHQSMITPPRGPGRAPALLWDHTGPRLTIAGREFPPDSDIPVVCPRGSLRSRG